MRAKQVLKKKAKAIREALSAYTINFSLFSIRECHLQDGKQKKIISFCLFGKDAKYFSNVDECIKSYRRFFPGWIIRVYLGGDVAQAMIAKLRSYDCETVIMQKKGADYRYTFWRFLALDDEDAAIVMLRDIDSIASAREQQMVEHWLASGKKLHVIRDHPGHTDPIMAGMWGVRLKKPGCQFRKKMLQFSKVNKFGIDQQFLATVYHEFREDIFVNDICRRFDGENPELIPHGSDYAYVGEINSGYPHKARHKKELVDFYQSGKAVKPIGI